MMWQDFVLTGANLIFGFLLIPQLKDVITDKQSLNLWSCGFTFFGLCIVNVTMVTLKLWLAAIPICTVIWGLLWFYSWRNKNDKDRSRM